MEAMDVQKSVDHLAQITRNLSKAEASAMASYCSWMESARLKQLPPEGDWNIWLILAGRGWGKTRTGAQDIVSYAMQNAGTICAVVAPTLGDLRRTCIEGPSGVISCLPKECILGETKSGWNSQTGEITLWNGSKIIGFSADTPDRLRGPQYHRVWCDELAAWRYEEAFDQLLFGLRLGDRPQMVITTTPRPTRMIKGLVSRVDQDVVMTSGSTFENVDNLAQSALTTFRERYEGTRLGRQELYAEVLTDIEGALWTFAMIDQARIEANQEIPEMAEIVVGVDPAVTAHENSDETGIVVACRDAEQNFYVIDDRSGVMSPEAWARTAIDCYHEYEADRIVCEVNQGGDLVTKLIKDIDPMIPVRAVRATRGKMLRAEPIAALYEQGRAFHLGAFSQLEDQMTSFDGKSGKKSPDRLDALVWAITELSESSGTVYWRIT